MEIWLCEGWLLLMLWKLNSNNFIFTEYTPLGPWSNPVAKIVVFMFFIHSGDVFCCRFHLGSRGGESCATGERGARDRGQCHGCRQHCWHHWFWQLDTRVLIAALGAAASPPPCWLCTVFLAVDKKIKI